MPAACAPYYEGADLQCINCMGAGDQKFACDAIAGCVFDPEGNYGMGQCAKKGDCDEEGMCCPADHTCQNNEDTWVRGCMSAELNQVAAVACPTTPVETPAEEPVDPPAETPAAGTPAPVVVPASETLPKIDTMAKLTAWCSE